ncbi:MAG: TrbG/VirB9 family P-type conjugative transfer protein [Treponema sp.]|nr:TrbG/VirB9 family P-type conjugative transfer protein [Treponema sp.]
MLGICSGLMLLSACATTKDLEKDYKKQVSREVEKKDKQKEHEYNNNIYVLDSQEHEKEIVYIDRPVYIPVEKPNPSTERGNETGFDAVVKSQKKATILPENYKDGTFYYQYNENLVYEVYGQPYHLTDIILEAGEVVISTPLLSDDETTWELTAGVAKDPITGEDIQHLFIKPASTKLDSSLVIITDRRVYHFRLKSYNSTYMSMVRFNYPNSRNQWAKKKVEHDKAVEIENDYIRITNPEFLSFDYKIRYSTWRKPEFLPRRVYDDGATTYIQVDDIVLQKKLPLIFNERNEIVNYSIKKNVFVIPRLVNKVTLRLGKAKVTVTKKKVGRIKANKIQKETESASGVNNTDGE